MRIYLDNKELIFDGKITVNSSHPFLDNDNERIDNIFSVGVPITGNEVALNYAYDIDALVDREFSCEITGQNNFSGIAIISEVSSKDRSVTLQIGYAKSNFNYLIKDKQLKDFDYGVLECESNLKTNCQVQNINWNYPFVNYNEKTYMSYVEGNNNYFANQGIYFAKTESIRLKIHIQVSFQNVRELKLNIGKDNLTKNFFIQNGKAGAGAAIDTYAYTTINGNAGDTHYIWLYAAPFTNNPQFTINYLIYNIEASINSDFLEGVNTKSYPEKNYCFPMIKNEKMFDFLPDFKSKSFYQQYPYLNEIFTSDFSLTRVINKKVILSKLIAPCIYVAHIIDVIFKELGYSLLENVFATKLKDLIVFNGNIVGDYSIVSNELKLIIPKEYPLYKAFDNDIMAKDFLISLYTITGYFPLFNHDTKIVEFVNVKDLLQEIIHIECEVIDSNIEFDNEEKGIEIDIDKGSDNNLQYTSIEDYNYKGSIPHFAWIYTIIDAKINDCYLVENEHKYYALLYKGGRASWKFVAYDYMIKDTQGKENYVTFKSSIPILVGMQTLLYNQANNYINIPITEQPIKIEGCYESSNNKWSNSFMFKRGLKTKTGLGEYLYASADVYYGNTIEDNKSLRVDGEFGLLKRIYSIIANAYQNGTKQNLTVLMKQSEISQLTYKNMIEVNNSVNLLLSYRYEQDESEYVQVELELIKI